MCLIIAFPLKKNFLKVFLQYQFFKNQSEILNKRRFLLFKFNLSVILTNNNAISH